MENFITVKELLIVFVILAIGFRGLELLRPKARRTPLLRKGLPIDLAYWIFNPLVAERVVRVLLLVVLAVFALAVYGRVDRGDILAGFGPIGRLPLAVQAVLMLIAADFIGYWTHRLFHGRRLWRFHAVHHSPTTLDWLSAARVHPINELAGRIASMLPLLGLGFQPLTLAWAGPVFGLFALLLHANVDWDWGRLRTVIASPRFHRWHHAVEPEARDKNFAALFPIWDLMFGTYYMPEGRVPERFGCDTPVPQGFLAQLMFPFRRGGTDQAKIPAENMSRVEG